MLTNQIPEVVLEDSTDQTDPFTPQTNGGGKPQCAIRGGKSGYHGGASAVCPWASYNLALNVEQFGNGLVGNERIWAHRG